MRISGRSNFPPTLNEDLAAFVEPEPAGPLLQGFVASISRQPRNTVDFLVELNAAPAAHDPLSHPHGAGRADAGGNARLRRRLLPRYGVAAGADPAPPRPAGALRLRLSHPASAGRDIRSMAPPAPKPISPTCMPGPKSICPAPAGSASIRRPGCCAAKATFPLAATPHYRSAAPISGMVEPSEVTFGFDMSVTRHRRTPARDGAVFRRRLDRARRARRASRCRSQTARCAPDHGRRTDLRLDRRLSVRGMEYRRARPDQARTRRRSDPPPARPLRAGRAAALRPGQMVSGRAVAALGLRAVLAPRRRADLAR